MQNYGRILVANDAALDHFASNAGTITSSAGSNTINGDYAVGGQGLANSGLITDSTAGSTLTVAGYLANTGTIAVSNATLVLDGSGLTDTGLVSVTNGVLDIHNFAVSQISTIKLVNSSVASTGNLQIDSGSALHVGRGTSQIRGFLRQLHRRHPDRRVYPDAAHHIGADRHAHHHVGRARRHAAALRRRAGQHALPRCRLHASRARRSMAGSRLDHPAASGRRSRLVRPAPARPAGLTTRPLDPPARLTRPLDVPA